MLESVVKCSEFVYIRELHKSDLLLLSCVRRRFYRISHCFMPHDFTVWLKMSREKKWTGRWVSRQTDQQRSKQAHEKSKWICKGCTEREFCFWATIPWKKAPQNNNNNKTHTKKPTKKQQWKTLMTFCSLFLQLFCVKWPPPPFPGLPRVRRSLLQQLEVCMAVGWR